MAFAMVATLLLSPVVQACPACTCESPARWPASGCGISCGASCRGTCCCIAGVGSCSIIKAQSPAPPAPPAPSPPTSPARIRANEDGWMLDGLGRVRIFRGFNDIQGNAKGQGPYDGTNYLPKYLTNETILQELEALGFNGFRVCLCLCLLYWSHMFCGI